MQPLEPRRGLHARSRSVRLSPSDSNRSHLSTTPLDTSPLSNTPLDTSPLSTTPLDSSPLSTTSLGTSPLNTSHSNSSHSDTSPTSRSTHSRSRTPDPRKSSGLIFRADAVPLEQHNVFRDIVISLLLFLLLSEWLRPLALLGDDTIRIGPILVVFAFCLALDCFRVPYGWGWLAKSSMIIFFIGYLFDRDQLFTGGWIISLMRTFTGDVLNIVGAHLDLISGEMRTLLFLMGWSLLLSVVQALMLQRQHSLWFVMATLTYLVGIQLVLGADTVQGIIRTFSYGLILLALLNLSRIEQTYRVTAARSRNYVQWLVISVIVVGILSGAGWLSAKQAEPTPLMKPVSWAHWYDRLFDLYNEETGVNPAVATSGYGQNDTSLGGPLQVDTSPVFTAKTSELTYWRGESKSFYDGKGWTQPNQMVEPFKATNPTSSLPTVTQEILLNDKSPNKQVFAGGQLLSVDMLLSEKGAPLSSGSLLISRASGRTALPEIAEPLSYYKITVQPVKENPDLLNTDTAPYPEDIANEYLQLPSTLPRAVRSLAEQVTANRSTPYAKAVAVEQYLSHTYPYSLEKPTTPSRSEDFVSHFLFVDQTGYCDQFSTAMVVMLRSVGVPARWVKGFAPGTAGAKDEEGLNEVVVRNQDAHSWVEVYFPSMGWVPFEPTPGFSGISSDQPRDTLSTATMEQAGMTASLTNTPLAHSVINRSSEWLQTMKNNLFQLVNAYRSAVFICIGVLCLIAALFVVLRRQGFLLQPAVHIPYYSEEPFNQHPLTPYMDRLWRQLFRKYGVKPANQTVREYVMNLPMTHPTQQQALMAFAQIYESIRYDQGRASAHSKREITAIWHAIQKTH